MADETVHVESEEIEVALWAPTEIMINGDKGSQNVPGLTHPLVPGLAVTSLAFGYFDVTHVPTGRRVGGGYERAWNAALLAVHLVQCLDWTGDKASIKAQMDALTDEPVPFAGATTTRLGVTEPMTKRDYLQFNMGLNSFDEFPWESGDDSPSSLCVDALIEITKRLGSKDQAKEPTTSEPGT